MSELKYWLYAVVLGSFGSSVLFRVADGIPVPLRLLWLLGIVCALGAATILGYWIGKSVGEWNARWERLKKPTS